MRRSYPLFLALVIAAAATGVFASEGEVRWVSSPALSPDGKAVVFATNALNDEDGCNDIWTLDLSTGGLQRLTSTDGVDEDNPTYSPDAKHIAFVQTDGAADSPFRLDRSRVCVMNPDGTMLHRVSRTGTSAFSAAWLGDSRRLVMATTGLGLVITDISGRELRALQCTGVVSNPSCSPDGRCVVYEREDDCRICYAQSRICHRIWKLSTATGAKPIRLTSEHNYDTRPRFSPDGTRIVFASDRKSRYSTSVYTMRADGTSVTRINTPGDACDASWMPDGRIVFVLSEPDPNALGSVYNLAVVRPDGTGLKMLTHTVASPVIQPPGGRMPSGGISISCSTAGAVVHYTTDGSVPTRNSPTYTAPIKLTGSATISAKAWKPGWLPSLITGREFRAEP